MLERSHEFSGDAEGERSRELLEFDEVMRVLDDTTRGCSAMTVDTERV